MSSITHSEVSDIALDSEGNIDTSKLEKSLLNALEFDVKYKQTDNMKKRACKVAGSYEEFKAMVDCAHLKTVSRQEIESLKAVKKGWTKASSVKNSASASILIQEENALTKSKQASISKTKLSSSGLKLPRTPLELERDFKRQSSNASKLSYLEFVGLAKVIQLLNVDADADLFENILDVLIASRNENGNHAGLHEVDENNSKQNIDIIEWLGAFSNDLKKFSLLYRFVNNDLKTCIKSVISGCPAAIVENFK